MRTLAPFHFWFRYLQVTFTLQSPTTGHICFLVPLWIARCISHVLNKRYSLKMPADFCVQNKRNIMTVFQQQQQQQQQQKTVAISF